MSRLNVWILLQVGKKGRAWLSKLLMTWSLLSLLDTQGMKGYCIRRQVLYCTNIYLKERLYSSITENLAKPLMYKMTIASNDFSVYNVMFTRSSRYLNCVRMCNKRKKTLVYYVYYSLYLLFWYRPLNLLVYMRTSKRECATREKKH